VVLIEGYPVQRKYLPVHVPNEASAMVGTRTLDLEILWVSIKHHANWCDSSQKNLFPCAIAKDRYEKQNKVFT
jgi:hypothetical protein